MNEHKHTIRGVTLIELMIVIVIISILAAMAYPSYVNYTRQTRRSDAQIALTQIAALQEKFFTRCNYYAVTLSGGSAACGTAAGNADTRLTYTGNSSPGGHYTLNVTPGNISGTCTAGSAAYTCGYTITATPVATGLQAGDGAYRIDALGVKQWDKLNNSFASGIAKWTDK